MKKILVILALALLSTPTTHAQTLVVAEEEDTTAWLEANINYAVDAECVYEENGILMYEGSPLCPDQYPTGWDIFDFTKNYCFKYLAYEKDAKFPFSFFWSDWTVKVPVWRRITVYPYAAHYKPLLHDHIVFYITDDEKEPTAHIIVTNQSDRLEELLTFGVTINGDPRYMETVTREK